MNNFIIDEATIMLGWLAFTVALLLIVGIYSIYEELHVLYRTWYLRRHEDEDMLDSSVELSHGIVRVTEWGIPHQLKDSDFTCFRCDQRLSCPERNSISSMDGECGLLQHGNPQLF